MATPLTYQDYLRLKQLLAQQGGEEGDEDRLAPGELHFIVVHQTHELWFKLMLCELQEVQAGLGSTEAMPRLIHLLRRVSGVLRLLVHTMEVMESLSPQEFLRFRDRLAPASGFQSVQWRELETLLEGPLRAVVTTWFDGLEMDRVLPLEAQLVDGLLEVDEQLVLWRHRHARMAERIIGRRTGTGGSTGVDYLDSTASKRCFPELWVGR